MTNKKLYLIGDPVDHSLSPLLGQRAAHVVLSKP